MPESSLPTCPHLGLAADRQSTLLYADPAHRCYASGRARGIDLEHQETYCLGGQYRVCPRFVEPSEAQPVRKPTTQADTQPGAHEVEDEPGEMSGGSSVWRVALWVLVGLLLALTAVYYGTAVLVPPTPPETPEELIATATMTPTATHTLPATGTLTPTVTAPRFLEPTHTPTPPPGGANYALSPAAWAVGWVASDEERGNHFGDSNVYSGVFDGVIYHGAIQFDLSAVPRGAPIHYGSLELTGLNDDRLGIGGVWEVRVLSDTIEYEWPSADYQDLHNARVVQSLAPALGRDDLDVRKVNTFQFSQGQLDLLEKRVLEEAKVSFRIDGPFTGANDLFSWDSGYGPTSRGAKPKLFLSVGQPPMTPPPREYVVVTNTPTPENVLTAAVLIARATVDATTTGTATPTPRNLATATPPGWIVVTNTPRAENAATAQILRSLATAEALTTGTATPLPPNVVTATWTPTPIVVTNTPTAENVFTAAAVAARITADATTTGTATATPDNLATATPNDWIVVTSTPEPENRATAEYLRALVTAEAIAIGTATPTAANMVTATPTATYVLITSVPAVGSISTAIAGGLFETATAIATKGTPTPLPPNWVTPIVVTDTPTAEDPVASTVEAAVMMLDAALNGTPTPTPPNVVTATPTATYVLITSVPAVGNISTAIAGGLFETATAIATKGTPTPLPPNWVTPVVLVDTPTPDDPATATVEVALAMLNAMLVGTPTPTLPNVVTATPTPTYVIITSVPMPENASTAIAQGLYKTATAIAAKGTPTPLPPNWVTPVVPEIFPVSDDPDMATVQAVQALLDAFVEGTPTPTPPNLWTATPTGTPTWTPTYVIITSVPTPGNISTAIARGLFETATAVAENGTPTPLPPNWVTPIVEVATPTPGDPSTATVQAALAMLNAMLAGTPTPTSPNVVTATPTATYVVITSVPTAGNVSTAIARGLFETATAIAVTGTPTPLPPNWVTPVVLETTPTPASPAEATALVIKATIDAIMIGTPTPTPANAALATATPWIVADAVLYPSPTPIPPNAIPPEFIGQVAFMSDREGGETAYYVMGADGSNVQRLSGPGVHEAAIARELMSIPCLPRSVQEVWVRETWLSNVRLSWSPGCDWIVFCSDRTLNEQVWVMDFRSTEDWGRTQTNISNSPYNDWSPVWIKPPVVMEGAVTP